DPPFPRASVGAKRVSRCRRKRAIERAYAFCVESGCYGYRLYVWRDWSMKVYATEDIRNVVLVGHGKLGKTMLADYALYESGARSRHGTSQDQNAVSDHDEDEHKRKYSLNTSLIPVEWEGRKINLTDTPGYADFIAEVICGAHAAD